MEIHHSYFLSGKTFFYYMLMLKLRLSFDCLIYLSLCLIKPSRHCFSTLSKFFFDLLNEFLFTSSQLLQCIFVILRI